MSSARFDALKFRKGQKTVNDYFYRFIETIICKRFHLQIFTINFRGIVPIFMRINCFGCENLAHFYTIFWTLFQMVSWRRFSDNAKLKEWQKTISFLINP